MYFKLCLREAGGDCASRIVLFDLLHAPSLCLLHNMNRCSACTSPLINQWIKQFMDHYFFIIALWSICRLLQLQGRITSLTNWRNVQIKVCPLCWKSRDRADPWTAYLVTRRKFKFTKLERKKGPLLQR